MMRALLVGALLLVVGCHKQAAPSAGSSMPATPKDPYAPVPRVVQSRLAAAMAQEAKDRPTATPSADKVFAAVQSAGLTLVKPPEQALAKMLEAHYCMTGSTPEGVSMSVCEYDDEAKAKAGRQMSEVKFKVFTNRTLAVNKKTMLTVNRTVDTPAANEQRDQVLALFAKL